MNLQLHPDIQIRKYTVGTEKAPLIVVDNVIANAEVLVEDARQANFATGGRFYPGIRTVAPADYQRFIAQQLGRRLIELLAMPARTFGFSMCHYSLVTTPPDQLELWQRMPHIDALNQQGLAAIHYLFKDDLGGTAFFRHRSTGFEYVDEARQQKYNAALEAEAAADPKFPGRGYIRDDNPYFEQIAAQEGIFNRMLVYRRNSLHTATLAPGFVPDANPATGRLSINSFIDIT